VYNAGVIDELRLVGIPGTNKVMAGELSRLAGRAFDRVRLPPPRREGLGTLVYPFDSETAALAVRYHRTASRVLWSLYQSGAARLEPLYDDLLADLRRDTRQWYRDGDTFSVAPVNLSRFAAGERQIVGVVKNALIDGAARKGIRLEVDPGAPDLRIEARMHDETVTISIDLAGRPMNQRGYRTGTGVAPLRENLAAVLVMLSRFDPRREVLVDPLAGSGTIAVEAACMARGIPVWVPPREPAARSIPLFADKFRRRPGPLFGDTRPHIVANELDRKIHGLSKKNMSRAGVSDVIESRCGDYRKLGPREIAAIASRGGAAPEGGVILSNPPYGERLRAEELKRLYAGLGEWCRRFPGWRAAFLVANRDFEGAFGGEPRIRKPLRNGPLKGYFYIYDL